MKLKSTLLALVAFALACVAFLAPQAFPPAFIVAGILAALIVQPSAPVRRVAVNGLEGTHKDGAIGRLTDEAFTYRYLFCKFGSDADHIGVADKGDAAIGLMPDECATADIGESRTVDYLRPTKRCRYGGTVAAGDQLLQTDNGVVIAEGDVVAAGTYTWVGRALVAGSSGTQGEFIPRDPILVQFIANGSTLSQTQAAMNGLKIVRVL
jgi:hypothetical protein